MSLDEFVLRFKDEKSMKPHSNKNRVSGVYNMFL